MQRKSTKFMSKSIKVINNGDVTDGKIDHIDIQGIGSIFCFNCPRLTQLPEWKKVNYVNCSDCTSLTQVPKWEDVTEVHFNDCPGLTQLPEWENVTDVYRVDNSRDW